MAGNEHFTYLSISLHLHARLHSTGWGNSLLTPSPHHKQFSATVSRTVLSLLQYKYTLSVQNIKNTFLILSCTPLCPQNRLNLSWHGLYKGLKAFHGEAGPCRLQCFPQLCQVGWMSFGWWTIPDTDRCLASTTIPCSKSLIWGSRIA